MANWPEILRFLIALFEFLLQYVFPATVGAAVGVAASSKTVARKAAEIAAQDVVQGKAKVLELLFKKTAETYVKRAVDSLKAK